MVTVCILCIRILGSKVSATEKYKGNAKMNGLREYLFAIAVEEITKTNLKEKGYGWSNGKEWLDQWEIY